MNKNFCLFIEKVLNVVFFLPRVLNKVILLASTILSWGIIFGMYLLILPVKTISYCVSKF